MKEECEKYLCGKNVYTPKEVLKELQRIRKENPLNFSTHPDFVKTTQCKDNVISEAACKINYPPPKPKAAPKAAPKAEPKTKKSTDKDFQQYKINLAALTRLKEALTRITEEANNVKINISRHEQTIKSNTAALDKLLSKKRPNPDMMEEHRISIDMSKKRITELYVNLDGLNTTMDQLKYGIQDLEEKNKQFKSASPTKPAQKSRCQKGTRRNKKTGKCDPY
jgi:predicted RNase H-like nuclease (RuvC/YqgF family)